MKRGTPTEREAKAVGIWIRVSTEDQAKGESPEHHERRARYYADSKNWTVKEVYHLEGVSGKSVFDHPETERMLSDVKRGHITGLIFSKLARLARNTRELLDFADLFRDADADLVSLQESIDTSTPAGRLFYTMIAGMAQWEREEIASRVSASVMIRAKMGKPLGGQAPFGYQWKDKKLVPHPDEAPIRRRMYELFLEHKRKKTVARILNDAGHRTRNGSKFSDTTVVRLLQDPTAKGKHRLNYTRSLGTGKAWEVKPESEWEFFDIDPIVPAELWDRCNGILDEKRKNFKRPARKGVELFAGLTFCECGGKMYVPSNNPKYICNKCRNKIPVGDLESEYVENLKGFFLSSEEVSGHLQQSKDALVEKEELLAAKRRELHKIEKESERTYRLYADEKLTADEFTPLFKPLQARKKELEDEIPKTEAEIDFQKVNELSTDEVLSEANELYSRWPSLTQEKRRSVVESITDKIVIGTGSEGSITIELAYMPSFEELTTEQRNFIRALPFCYRAQTVKRVKKSPYWLATTGYPESPKTVGEHIRKRRLDLGLTQRQVGERIGVLESSVWNWEAGGRTPEFHHLPAIIAFLGYNPTPRPKTLAETLVWFRQGKGWTQTDFARALEVDPSTLARWERGEREPMGEYRTRVASALQGMSLPPIAQ